MTFKDQGGLTWLYQLYSSMMMRQVNLLISDNLKLFSGTEISLTAFPFSPVGTSVAISQPSGLHTHNTHSAHIYSLVRVLHCSAYDLLIMNLNPLF